jgi:SAM-dependent methyltransferase
VDGLRAGRAACAITAAAEAEAAAAYVSPSPDDLFEPRRETCPWCDAGPLVEHVRTTDLFQHKPGEFHLDRCTACGHIFQNPRLSVAGLDHYYADFYEGSGGDLMDRIFGAAEADCHKRIQFLLDADVAPTSWVDVGTGHGHFGLFARQQWPDARIDGLDLSTSVLEAGRRGWLDEAHHGLFPDLADQLANRYDGLSMHHYLEHTTDPDRELDAAAKVLGHGGLLQIEVPDPESHWERRLGRYWIPWFQPQHLNLVPYDNLIAALDERDFDIVQVERDINDPYQVLSAVALMIENVMPSGHFRWRPRGNGYHLARAVLMTAALPVYTGAIVSDLLAYALRDKATPGVTYRVLARKR